LATSQHFSAKSIIKVSLQFVKPIRKSTDLRLG
jgi:hypothetical protein